METQGKNIRVRFAPSPTGYLHIGGVRSAIFNWLFARHNGGSYLLRIEDTDVARSTKEYLASQIQSLTWLGLLPDEPIVYQMSRIAEHQKAAKGLMDKGLAYPCFCAPRAADDVISDLDQGVGAKYSGACRDKKYTDIDLEKPHALRFKLPHDSKTVTFQDVILGPITVDIDQLDDYVIMRRDGTPIYNFCVVVDDIFMKITHVIRGQDHVSNTPKQVLLYRALGHTEPLFAHIPLILGPTGAKLSKRDAAVSVEEYRQAGYMPDALFNYLVRLGWSHGDQEVFDITEMINFFDLDHVGKKGSIFDLKKLQWLNAVYMRKATSEKIMHDLALIDPALPAQLREEWDAGQLDRLVSEYKQRAVTLVELHRDMLALASDPAAYDLSLMAKWHTDKTHLLLSDFARALELVSPFDHEQLLACAQEIAKKHDDKLVNIAQPLRLALTGSTVSPGVFELVSVLGKERSVRRINALVAVMKK